MINQKVTITAPIKVIPSMEYYLVIEDANKVRHYFHKRHKNKYGSFKQGQYDGNSKANEPYRETLNLKDSDIDINKN